MAFQYRADSVAAQPGLGTVGSARRGGPRARAPDLGLLRAPAHPLVLREDEMAAADGAPLESIGLEGGSSVPVPGLRWRRTFPGHERQLGVLRRWLASLLPECAARDDVACVATELSTNALRHTASGQHGFTVEITWYSRVVRIAVEDGGATEGPRVIDDPAGEHGRGLLLVKGMSARMGVCGDHRGRLVWADIPWDEVAAGPASPGAHYEAAIHDGEAALARRFVGVSAWFGRSTLAWWAMVRGDELVSAPSPGELAALLYRLLHTADQAQSVAQMQPLHAPGEKPASHHRHPGIGSPNAERWMRSESARVGPGGQALNRESASARRAAVNPRLKALSAVSQACA